MRVGSVIAVAAVAVLLAAGAASASRAPTYLERATIMDTFNIPGRAFASACVKIVVSTVDSRFAMLTGPRRVPKNCQVGNGFVLFKRTSAKALRWKNVYEGSGLAPCLLPAAVRRDFGFTGGCN